MVSHPSDLCHGIVGSESGSSVGSASTASPNLQWPGPHSIKGQAVRKFSRLEVGPDRRQRREVALGSRRSSRTVDVPSPDFTPHCIRSCPKCRSSRCIRGAESCTRERSRAPGRGVVHQGAESCTRARSRALGHEVVAQLLKTLVARRPSRRGGLPRLGAAGRLRFARRPPATPVSSTSGARGPARRPLDGQSPHHRGTAAESEPPGW